MTERVLAPKLGQNINKRFRVYTASAVLTTVLLLFQLLFSQPLSGLGVVVVSGIFGLLAVLLGIWVLNFKGNAILFGKVFFLPFALVSVITFTLRQVFFTELTRLADIAIFSLLLLVFGGVVYTVLLSANILFISDRKSIPLVQVAHTAWYILTLSVVFIFTYWTIAASPEYFFSLPVLIVAYFMLSFQHLAHFELSNRSVVNKSVAIALGMVSAVLIFAFWPTNLFVKALAPTLAGYVGLGLAMHEVKKVLEPRVAVEYVLLTLFLVLLLILTSSWGIFGRLF
jgi:hypothetical protein